MPEWTAADATLTHREDDQSASPLLDRARQLAQRHGAATGPGREPNLLEYTQEYDAVLERAHQAYSEVATGKGVISYAAEWLLDNYYVVRQALRQVSQDMPPGYYRQLPKLSTSSLAGYPRVYDVAREIVGMSDARLDQRRIIQFVHAYQQIRPLTMGELWALPTMLRFAILQVLAQALQPLDEAHGADGKSSLHLELLSRPEQDTVVANAILSLRMLGTQDWDVFFEALSLVDRVLGNDPAGVYTHMDFETRDRYRKVIEELALSTGQSEEHVAKEAIHLASAGSPSVLGYSIERVRHVGFYLLDKGRSHLEAALHYRLPPAQRARRWLLDHPTGAYLAGIAVISCLLLWPVLGYTRSVGAQPVQLLLVGCLAAVVVLSMSIAMWNWFLMHILPPRVLPKLDFGKGIAADCRTMIVVPSLITSEEEARSLLRQIELHYLRNYDPHLAFALLTDFADAVQAHMPGDEELLTVLALGISALNEKHHRDTGAPFFAFHRERRWNAREGCWMGWERKRGKLEEFNRLLVGESDTSYTTCIGDLSVLRDIRYVITLDADTLLPLNSARRLVAALSHPLNRAEFDPQTGTVIAGYTVLQPRAAVQPSSANRTLFSRVFAGDAGVDLYSLAVSEVYQDLFGEGIFAGKGIYDVATFKRSLEGCVPENALLSHDMFEGIHGRAGLVSDIVVYEDSPRHYLIHVQRLHRWVRGDWQLLPWLGRKCPQSDGSSARNRLSLISRWKIVDNLRRSLLVPTLLAFLILGWLWLPGSPWYWTALCVLALGISLILGLIDGLVAGLQGGAMSATISSGRLGLLRWLVILAFLPYETLILVDAILTTVVRLFITRQRLLQWTTSAHTARLFGRQARIGVWWQRMRGGAIIALVIALSLALFRPTVLMGASPLLLLWLGSPYIARWLNRPLWFDPHRLDGKDVRELRLLMRRTWLYFERFVGPEDNWLPPDHYQDDPLAAVAHRTSPTNIGLYLLSVMAAYDLGYVGLFGLAARLQLTLGSMEELERHRGHLLNWYDTQSRRPLPARYVSTVDSGNLAAALMALAQGCRELQTARVLRWMRLQGLVDTLEVLLQAVQDMGAKNSSLAAYLRELCADLHAARTAPQSWFELLRQLRTQGAKRLDGLLMALVQERGEALDVQYLRSLSSCVSQVHHQLHTAIRELGFLMPWSLLFRRAPDLFAGPLDPVLSDAWDSLVSAFPVQPTLAEIPGICELAEQRLQKMLDLLSQCEQHPESVAAARTWCLRLRRVLRSGGKRARGLLSDYEALAVCADQWVREMDFAFLLEPLRSVFHIGYNVDTARLDDNYYDLLASEARLASLVAIAKHDVPPRHWLHMARPLGQAKGAPVLLSWSGTMFEYLMPSLLVRDYPHSLLGTSCRAAVDIQIEYGRARSAPWGVSESGYYAFDAGRHYQYRAFGVPDLGLKRGLGEDFVVSPYASILALRLRPQEVMRNVRTLVGQGMLGTYGMYEAVDYTPLRAPLGRRWVPVKSYMAHHQAMIALSVANYLSDDAMVRRFHNDPRIQSVELLLQEQIPEKVPLEGPATDQAAAVAPPAPQPGHPSWSVPLGTSMPHVHTLSNGRYGVLITDAGTGYSWWQDDALTRWQADGTLDSWGTWVYLQDRDSGAIWSVGTQPLGQSGSLQVQFAPHLAEFVRREQGISVRMQVTVSSTDDVEIRRISLTNDGDGPRRLRVTTYGEVVLAPRTQDLRHPAFSKLFVESEYMPEVNGVLFRRRSHASEGDSMHLLHAMILEPGLAPTRAHECDRMRFLGRGGSPRDPAALRPGGLWLTGTTGFTLDPIMSLGQEIDLGPHESASIAVITAAARSRLEALARQYQYWPTLERVFGEMRAQSERELNELGFGPGTLPNAQRLLSVLMYPHPGLRAAPSTIAANQKGQSGLWTFGISGDYPILLVRVHSQESADLLRELLRAHTYWRDRQLRIDMVILNEQDTSYDQELHGYLQRLVSQMDSDEWVNRRGGIFILHADQLPAEDRVLLETVAHAVLDDEAGTLAEQLAVLDTTPVRLPEFSPTLTTDQLEDTPAVVRPDTLLFDNGWGGFGPDGREYIIYLEPDRWTPAPWCNVVANPDFGFLVSESGGGYTWAVNSGENRLTPWHNDPVTDVPGEALYLRDEETGLVWSPTPLPARDQSPYLVRHGAGYSSFEHNSQGVRQRLRLFVVPDAPIKIAQLHLENTWSSTRRITATYYAEWVLGTLREVTQRTIVPEYEEENAALLAWHRYNSEFGQRVAFLASSEPVHGFTTDRTEFLGERGSIYAPAALGRIGLGNTLSPGQDPCAALQIHISLEPGESRDVCFLIGQAASRDDVCALIARYRDMANVETAWADVRQEWDSLLSTIEVKTPDPSMDLMLNGWLLHQTLSCRIWGRSGLYQSSGAYGYRDQLQDVMALACVRPGLLREHLLEAASHQFQEGDVLHWWHPPSGRGIRTRCSDDLLWLPIATAHYVRTTGDEAILSERVPFIAGNRLAPEELERYDHYERADEEATLYEHCLRAIDRATTAGSHGLPLIGSGDWNDGMNHVGIQGRGESVWLGWFLYATLNQFAPLCERLGDRPRAQDLKQGAAHLLRALEGSSWDGAWYVRGYYDDGVVLGSAQSLECQIDSIAQSWAILSCAAGASARGPQAMASVGQRLVRREDGLICLFAPPFDKTTRDPGYIKAYPPGIRENGGQYTHAAVWAVWAFAELGDGDLATELFHLINPINHGHSEEEAARYRVEPYVVAGDVYSVSPHVGRGGWTWYTGSAGWMYRLGIERILGLQRRGRTLQIDPRIPHDWPGYELTYRDPDTGTCYSIHVVRAGSGTEVRQVTLDGETLDRGEIPLLRDGAVHDVGVTLGHSVS